ncbi:hypothetical protein BGZ61DRAFT_461787 [Ilyonectria robusta]|uniref:uncharacterized protein n=1 Tax=Ilyonectria robusta TaxID=1079257 RepID=UPI001E8D651F|nr:uncharacterized protein BGZ61DRAFT_461787 [Ilyonectria robusta]KAH8666247.1 hypothetical protein BGZ61DRAFT_461787 [Ilyonectria robusta]
MVFSGKPSTACHTCREKRRKCDRIRPACTQCFRQKIPCPGYRDTSELRFRDETGVVAHKVQRAKKKRLPTQDASCSSTLLVSSSAIELLEEFKLNDDVEEIVLSPLGHNLSIDVLAEPTAITYFMTSFIIASPFQNYLPGLYQTDPLAKDAVSSAIRAASFATFALRVRDASYMKTARSSYALALAQTNTALASPKEAALDRTLAAVLLLGLFEAIIFEGRESPESWTAHTLGALELLRLRGKQQFQSQMAQHLFIQTITNIRTSCVQRIVPVPTECLTLHDEAIQFLNAKDPALRLGPIIDRVASLRARATASPVAELLYEARDLDNDTVALMDGLEDEMRYTMRPKEDTPAWAYLGIAFRYPNHRVAKFWSAIRMIRMLLNELIWRGVSLGLDDPHPQLSSSGASCHDPLCSCVYLKNLKQMAGRNMAEVATGVLASVPDFLEPTSNRGKFCPSARTLIWPLSILLTSSVYSSSMRKYAVVFLHELGRDLNLPQAVDTARMLGESEVAEDWLHLYHLA